MTTENVGVKHLLNIKSIAFRRENIYRKLR